MKKLWIRVLRQAMAYWFGRYVTAITANDKTKALAKWREIGGILDKELEVK